MPIDLSKSKYKSTYDWFTDSHECYPKMENIDIPSRLNSVSIEDIEKYLEMKKIYKKGEKLICIKEIRFGQKNLKLGEIYTISDTYINELWELWFVINDEYYHNSCFISLKKQRKEKLDKLND